MTKKGKKGDLGSLPTLTPSAAAAVERSILKSRPAVGNPAGPSSSRLVGFAGGPRLTDLR